MNDSKTLDASGDLGAAIAGELRIAGGAAHLAITGASLPGQLYRAHFLGLIPTVVDDNGMVTIRYRRRPHPFAADRGEGTVELSSQVPWAIHVHDAAAHLTANLTGLTLTELTFDAAVADVTLDLPYPAGEVSIRIEGPVRNLRLRRPSTVPIGIRIHGAANHLRIDGEELGAVAGGYSNGAPPAPDRYTLDIAKTIDGLTVTH